MITREQGYQPAGPDDVSSPRSNVVPINRGRRLRTSAAMIGTLAAVAVGVSACGNSTTADTTSTTSTQSDSNSTSSGVTVSAGSGTTVAQTAGS